MEGSITRRGDSVNKGLTLTTSRLFAPRPPQSFSSTGLLPAMGARADT